MTDDFREAPDQDQPKYGDPEDSVPLFDMDPRKAAETIYLRWKRYPKDKLDRERAEFKVNEWRLQGKTNCFVQKTQDQGTWKAWCPPFHLPPTPVLNKAKRLCRRLTSMQFADPPVVESAQDDAQQDDFDAISFSIRALNHLQSEGQLNGLRNARRAFYRACAAKKGYIRYYADPKGGGRQPVRVMAKPGATSADQPFTGPMGEPLDGDPIGRYVREDGSLTDKPEEAATQWTAGLKQESLHALNLRLFPHDAEDIWEAHEAIIGIMPTWGEVLDTFPEETAEIAEEDKQHIFNFKPENAKDLLTSPIDKLPEHGKNQDDRERRVPMFLLYCKAGATYPDGCEVIVLADRVLLRRKPWVGEVDGKRIELDIPITEYGQFEGGEGLMDLLGGGNEIRSAQVGALLQYMDQFLNRKTYVPTNSILQGKSNLLAMGTQLSINPGGEPKHEEIPPFPSQPLDMFALMSTEMDDESGLQETAQGTQNPDVNSGVQASVIVAQAQAGLTDVKQNTERAWLRQSRIILQLAAITYTVPQQIDWVGEDGKYKQKWWTGSDLKTNIDIRLKPGSLSMMTPPQKLQLAMQFAMLGPMSPFAANPDQFHEVLANTMGPTVGITDDPQRQRIKRQLAEWSEGPPEGWMPQQAPVDPMTGQPLPQMDQTGVPVVDQTGQPVMRQAPPDPALMAIFAPNQVDELQDVAMTRLAELKRFLASSKYTRWPPEWRLGVDTEFAHMKQAAGVMTVQEQQIAAQQQADQQMQAETDGKMRDADARAQDGDRQSAEKQADRDLKMQGQESQQRHEQSMAQMQQAA